MQNKKPFSECDKDKCAICKRFATDELITKINTQIKYNYIFKTGFRTNFS